MRRALFRALVVLAGVALATPAISHATLLLADPADGVLMDAPPTTLTLTFDEPVEVTVLRLAGPDGEVADLTDYALAGNALIVTPPPLEEGTHILSWRVVSADGHPVGGALAFSIGTVTGTSAGSEAGEPLLGPLIWIARVAIYGGLFIGVAGAFFGAWIAAPMRLPPSAHAVVKWSMIGGLVAVPIAFALQGVDLLGGSIGSAFAPASWAAALKSTYTATLISALAALTAGLASMASPSRARVLSGIGLLAVGAAFALSGHASRAPPQALTWLVVFIHTVAAAFWAGALAPLAFVLKDASRGSIAVLARFSAVIPHSIAPLIIAGVLLIFVQLDSIADLWSTGYGRILAAKLAAVTALFVLAVVNRYRLTPAVKASPASGGPALRRSITAEVAIVLVVFGLVAGWRFTPPPRSEVGPSTAVAAVPSFNHFHGAEMAADITLTPAETGPIGIAVVLYTAEIQPLAAEELTISLINEEAGIGPLVRQASVNEDGNWFADGFILTVPGVWTVQLSARVSTFEQRTLSGPVLIHGPEQPAAAAAAAANDGHDHEHAAAPNIDVTDPFQVVAVDAAEAPTIAMDVEQAGPGLWNIVLELGNFRFAGPDDGAYHVIGLGHAHVFVDNQYIAQLDALEHQLTLPTEGVVEIFVGLNGLDHRAYVADGVLIGARIALAVSETATIGAERVAIDIPIVLSGDPPTFSVERGDTVELRLTSVNDQVVHLHGYDLEVALGPQSPVTMLFNAEYPGRFVAEAHDAAETPVFFLEVRP